MDLLTIGLGALGSILGSEGQNSGGSQNGTSNSNSSAAGEGFTQNFIDPRFEPYIYGQGGVLGSAYDWYNQNRGGTNPQSLEGMNNQWAQLGASKQGFDAMQNLGMGMMGQGSTGNPFSGGYQGGGTFPTTGIAPQNLTYTPAQFGQGGPFVERQIAPVAAPQNYYTPEGGGAPAAPSGFTGDLLAALRAIQPPPQYNSGREGADRMGNYRGGGDDSGGYGGWGGGDFGGGEA